MADKEPADIFHAGDDALEAPTKAEQQGHETLAHHKERLHMEGATDAKLLQQEGADLPHDTTAGHVRIHGPADPAQLLHRVHAHPNHCAC